MKFKKRILLIILIATAILYLLNKAYEAGNRKYYRHEMSRLDVLVDENFYTDILFIGSSRTHVHNNPKIIDSITHLSSYNFGVEGGSLIEMNLWLQVYLQKHRKPKLVVLDLPPFAFDTEKKKIFKHTIYFPYMNNDIIYGTLLAYKNVRLYKYLPFLQFIELDDYNKANAVKGLLGNIDPSTNVYNYNGYIENGTDSIRVGTRIPHDTNVYEIRSLGKKLFQTIIDTCRNQGIQLILTYSPEYFDTDYSKMVSFFSYINSVAQTNKLTFLDYRKSAICKNNTYFLNPGHLNKYGASVFSEALAHDILQQMRK